MNGLPTYLFIVSCAFLFYVIAGYPLLLKILSKFTHKPVKKGDFLPTVAMVIPARNAAAYLHRKLDSVLAFDYPRELLDVLVISYGSTDETDGIARSYAAWDVRLLQIPDEEKTAALNAAAAHTRSSILVLSDVWQTMEPGSLRDMMKCFADPAVGMVSGEVIMHGQGYTATERNLSMFARIDGWFADRLSDLDSMLGAGGSFFAIRRPLMAQIPPDTLLADLYVAMGAFFRGFRIVVEPAAFAFDNGLPREPNFKEQVQAQAGDYQMMKQYPGLLNARNRMRFHYWSYKVARLLLPFSLMVIAATSFQLHSRRAVITALSVQGVIYGLAAIDPWLSGTSFLKRITAALRTFVVTMLASLCAIPVLFVPPQKLWKPDRSKI